MSRITSIDEFKNAYPFYLDGKVEWGDMDSFGHVNNARYISYFERIRAHFFEVEGIWSYKGLKNTGPILAATSCKFILPLDYPDNLLFGLSIGEVSHDAVIHKYGVYSLGQDSVAAIGDGKIVFTNYGTGQKVDIPAQILARHEPYIR
jgi:acyl-CoA thioester hydrolase